MRMAGPTPAKSNGSGAATSRPRSTVASTARQRCAQSPAAATCGTGSSSPTRPPLSPRVTDPAGSVVLADTPLGRPLSRHRACDQPWPSARADSQNILALQYNHVHLRARGTSDGELDAARQPCWLPAPGGLRDDIVRRLVG